MDFKQSFKAFLDAHGMSQAEAAKRSGLSESYVSKTLADEGFKYAEQTKTKLLAFMAQFKQPGELFIHTYDAKGIFHRIELAREDGVMCAIAGQPGTGKSKSIKEYAARHAEAVLFEGTGASGCKALVSALAERLGLASVGTVDALAREIAAHLAGSKRVIIIDEAENLKHPVLEILRRIHDFSGAPIILVGTNKLLNNLTGNGKKDGNEYSQLHSRVGYVWKMRGLAHDEKMSDLRAVCAAYGVCDDECITTAYQITGGRFRSLALLLKRAHHLASVNNASLSVSTLKNAASVLLL